MSAHEDVKIAAEFKNLPSLITALGNHCPGKSEQKLKTQALFL
ncbi:hypothetical protein ACOYXV_02100 [Aeromonas veronii]